MFAAIFDNPAVQEIYLGRMTKFQVHQHGRPVMSGILQVPNGKPPKLFPDINAFLFRNANAFINQCFHQIK